MKYFLILGVVGLLAAGCNFNNHQVNLDFQAKCSTQSKEVFDSFSKGNNGGLNYSYENHYNSKDNKCYLLIKGYGVGGTAAQLWDGYENKLISQCEVFTGAADADICSYNGSMDKYDINKFNNFVKSYMAD